MSQRYRCRRRRETAECQIRASELSYTLRRCCSGRPHFGAKQMAKIQGEGDYESARRYNARTRKFVAKKGKAATKRATGGVDAGALRKAKSKSKARRTGRSRREGFPHARRASAARPPHGAGARGPEGSVTFE